MTKKESLWLSTSEYGRYVKCPDTGISMTPTGWSHEGTYLNGGGYAGGSTATHRVYQASFVGTQDEIEPVLDFPLGLYGSGPFYMIDPFSYKNILPKWLSQPRLMAQDAPTFQRSSIGGYVRPTVEAGTELLPNLPGRRTVFTLAAAATSHAFQLPHPNDKTLAFRWWGEQTSTARVMFNGSAVTPGTTVTVEGASGTLTRALSIVGGASGGTLKIAGMMLQLIKPGDTPDFSVFRSGRGLTAADIRVQQVTGYSAVHDRIGASLNIKEVGGWL